MNGILTDWSVSTEVPLVTEVTAEDVTCSSCREPASGFVYTCEAPDGALFRVTNEHPPGTDLEYPPPGGWPVEADTGWVMEGWWLSRIWCRACYDRPAYLLDMESRRLRYEELIGKHPGGIPPGELKQSVRLLDRAQTDLSHRLREQGDGLATEANNLLLECLGLVETLYETYAAFHNRNTPTLEMVGGVHYGGGGHDWIGEELSVLRKRVP